MMREHAEDDVRFDNAEPSFVATAAEVFQAAPVRDRETIRQVNALFPNREPVEVLTIPHPMPTNRPTSWKDNGKWITFPAGKECEPVKDLEAEWRQSASIEAFLESYRKKRKDGHPTVAVKLAGKIRMLDRNAIGK